MARQRKSNPTLPGGGDPSGRFQQFELARTSSLAYWSGVGLCGEPICFHAVYALLWSRSIRKCFTSTRLLAGWNARDCQGDRVSGAGTSSSW